MTSSLPYSFSKARLHGRVERLGFLNAAAGVLVESGYFQTVLPDDGKHLSDIFEQNPEFRQFSAGHGFGVVAVRHVGIEAQADLHAGMGGARLPEPGKFTDIHDDAGFEDLLEFFVRHIVGGVDDFFGGEPQFDGVLHLAGADGVDAASGIPQEPQHGGIEIGLQRVVQLEPGMGDEAAEIRVTFEKHISIVDEKRSAEAFRKG